MFYKFLFGCFWLLFSTAVQAQNKLSISGYVRDLGTGEDLIGANVSTLDADQKLIGTSTNTYGFYSISLPKAQYTLVFSYIGYAPVTLVVDLQKDTTLNINLSDAIQLDSMIVVTAEAADKNVKGTEMGTIEISVETAKKLPALLGEVDIIKTMQLLPGVRSAGEGNAGFYVRGGTTDQNLILLDDAVVYNSGHLLGFFSVFNSDAIKNATLIKGGMPANYGGRISSVLDIQMKEGNSEQLVVEGGIGVVASRLTVQAPLYKNKASFIASARRTYVFDIAQPFLKGTRFEGTNYYFYDLNLKANWRISQKDRIFLSGYFGRDVLLLNQAQRDFVFRMNWGNATGTIRWNHLFSDKLFMNALLIWNNYDFTTSGGQSEFKFKLQSGINDLGAKIGFDYFPSPAHKLKFGTDYTLHKLTPNSATATSTDETFTIAPLKRYGQEMGAYILDDWTINPIFSINMGLRLSLFQQLGGYQSKIDTNRFYKSGEIVRTYYGIEPRISGKISTSKTSSLKFGATLGNQYLHLVSNSASTLPTDLWVSSSELIKPQIGAQYALGYFQNFENNMYETSVEVYYKDLYNQLDYSETFTPTPDTDVEDNFISGRGHAYGVELLVRKNKGKLTGWLSYTYSRSFRVFDQIQGRTFPSRFDRPNDIALVLNYDINARWNVGATFIYGTGSPYTPIKSVYFIGLNPTTEYGNRNTARLPDYHRADLSVSYKIDPETKPFSSTLVLSIYNVYNRKNVFFTYTNPETNQQTGAITLKSYKVSLFPIIPSITWNFVWKKPRKK
jgi:CarboxypepD_reg-like domain/TonB-dependent Receptor Plug Domain